MRLFAPVVGLFLLLGSCTPRGEVGNDAVLYQSDNAGMALSPGGRPVRIGESGSASPACPVRGEVANLNASGMTALPLRAAPFEEADSPAALAAGRRLFLCTRSLDQRWQGVVIPPEDDPDADCGVTAEIAVPRDYAGPCLTGWVQGAYVRPLGG